VKCNGPAKGLKLSRNFTWHHPALYLLLFFNAIIYCIVAVCVRKAARMEIGLCERHFSLRRNKIIVSSLIGLAGIMGAVSGIRNDAGSIIVIGAFLALAALAYGLTIAQTVSVVKIDKEFVQLKGLNKDYLAALPEWRG